MNDSADVRRPVTDYDLAGLRQLMQDAGQPAYRGGQLARWLYHKNARSYDEMTDLPSALRDRLSELAPFTYPTVLHKQVSADGTRKYLLGLHDGSSVETVGLPTADRLTVCFSAQVGCAMGCTFCATGASGFVRHLGPGEMVQQLAIVASDFGERITNAVAMGQGEPFANYDNTLAALRIINAPDGLGIGARHLTVSTCGLLPGIKRFAEEPEQFTLAVSLHSAIQKVRDQIMPGVSGMPITALREAIATYTARTGRRCSLEYALIDGVNDSDDAARALAEFCAGMLVHVNLIPVNPVADLGTRRSAADRVAAFEKALAVRHTEVTVRTERGADIDAACGQLRQHVRP